HEHTESVEHFRAQWHRASFAQKPPLLDLEAKWSELVYPFQAPFMPPPKNIEETANKSFRKNQEPLKAFQGSCATDCHWLPGETRCTGGTQEMRWQPDPTFYPSPSMAMEAPAEKLAYVAMLNPTPDGGPDAMGVVDVDPGSHSYGR